MDNGLFFVITPKEPDFDYVPVVDLWCSYEIVLHTEQQPQRLLYHEWDFVTFCEWVAAKAAYWCNEELEIDGFSNSSPTQGESLCQAIRRLLDKDFENDDDEMSWYESLWLYSQRHSLQYGLRGARIPGMLIGRNGDHGEISVCDKDNEWAYAFAMRPFVETLIFDLKRVLSLWEMRSPDPKVASLITALRLKLDTAALTL